MTSQERADYNNGIWMCRTHGNLIDLDESRFTTELLQQWRQRAEKLAARDQALGDSKYELFDLFEHSLEISRDNISEEILGNAFLDAGISEFWGREPANSIRDFVYEVSLNALKHGKANLINIFVTPKLIDIEYDGTSFDPKKMLSISSGRGGSESLRYLISKYEKNLILSHSYINGHNKIAIKYIRSKEDINEDNPCTLDMRDFYLSRDKAKKYIRENQENGRLEGCDYIYVLISDYTSYSTAFSIKDEIPELLNGRRVIFVGSNLVSEGVQDALLSIEGSDFLETD